MLECRRTGGIGGVTLIGSDGKARFGECLIMNREGGNGEKVSPKGEGRGPGSGRRGGICFDNPSR
jgi:hypothetical protein